MKQFDKVQLVKSTKRILNLDMINWMKEHQERVFKVERSYEDRSFGWPVSFSIKLYKVDFWISEDLLEYEKA